MSLSQAYKDTYSNGIYINSQADNSNTFIYISTPNLNNSVTLILPDNDGDNDQVLTTDGDGNLIWSDKESSTLSANKYFDAYDATGGANINSITTITFDTERENPNAGVFDMSGGIITVNLTDKFMFIYRVSINNVNGADRSDFISYMERNSGSGWLEEPGTRGHGYNRLAGEGMSTVTVATILDVSTGDQFRIRAFRDSGSDDLETIADGSSISIFSIRNSGSGPQGPAGQEGPKGDPGTASDFINIYNSNNGSTDITSTAQTIPYNTISNESGSIFELSNNELAINATDDFMIQYTVSMEHIGGTGNGDRTIWQTWLERDNGSGFFEVDGTRGSGYARMSGEGENTSMSQAIVSVTNSATFRVRAQDVGTNRPHRPITNGCSMVAYTLRGGEQGPAGIGGGSSTLSNLVVGVNTDTQSSGTLDNYNIESESAFVRIDATGDITLNGIESDNVEGGQLYYLVNVGTGDLTIVEDSAPDPDDGILTGSGNITLLQNGTVTIIYDGTSGRWRVFSTY